MKDGRTLLNTFYMYYKKDHREGGKYLGSLSNEEFKRILELPVGMPRSYLSQMRKSFKKSNTSKYIIHIPHASLEVPNSFKKNLLVSEDYFNKENIFISDYKVDDFVPKNFPNIVKFKCSRMFCDVEKYLDDSKEEMSKYGMGVLYTKDSNGIEFVKRDNKDYIISNYYKKHHESLDNKVEELLNLFKYPIIIDLHSFSDEFVSKVLKKDNCPDICIGINKNNYDLDLLVKTINHFTKYGYSVMINYPYSGSIISNKYPKVTSIMIEINKRVYLSNKDNYNKFYKCMMNYYKLFDILK